jgi:hypothetical protein
VVCQLGCRRCQPPRSAEHAHLHVPPAGTIPEGENLYSGQATVQIILLLLAFAQVPILLFLKPFYLRWEHNHARAKGYRGLGETSRVSALDGDDEDESARLNGNGNSFDDGEGVAMISQNVGDDEHEEFEFSEVMIHQVIHTIGKSLLAISPNQCHLLTKLVQSSVSTAFPTLPRTYVSGLCLLPISSCPLSCGA